MKENNSSNVVVMAVNNPATNDFRVVKSAEMVAKAGYDCHVVGILKPGYVSEERINGVTYHRVKLRVGFSAIVAGVNPTLFLYSSRLVGYRNRSLSSGRFSKGLKPTKLADFLIKLLNIIIYIPRLIGVLSGLVIFYFLVLTASPVLISLIILKVFWRVLIVNIIGAQINTSVLRRSAKEEKLTFREIKSSFKKIKSSFKKIKSIRKKKKTIIQKWLKLLFGELGPQHSPHGVRYLQGRYLASFHQKLMSLNGGVYHAHELWMLESCSIVAKSLGSKLVYDSHELERHRNNNWSITSNTIRCEYEKRYIHNADVVFAVSEGCAQEIAGSYKLKEVQLLRNTPMLSVLVETEKNLRRDLGIGTDTKLIIYTGSVTFNRGVELIIRALSHLPRYNLVTIGPWNKDVKLELEALAVSLKVQDRFYMHPEVSPAELISLASQGDLSVIPIQDACLSYRYCLPNKIFEAAFAGLPIVASSLPDMERFITENDLGMVFESDSVESLVEAINLTERNNCRAKILSNVGSISQKNCFEKESLALTNAYQMLFNSQLAKKV